MSKPKKGLIENPMKDLCLPDRLPDEELKVLTEKLRAGQATTEDIERLAFGHIRLAFHYAKSYAGKQLSLSDVFVSDALFGLAMALANAPEKLKHDNLTRYIVAWIKKYCFRTLTEDRTVTVPYSTIKRRQKKGLSIVIPKIVKAEESRKSNAQSLYDLKDTIESCIKQEFEREVIELRKLGFTDEEISVKLNCSRPKVTGAKNDVYRRFLAAMEET